MLPFTVFKMLCFYRRVKLLGVAQYYIIYRSRDHTIGSHFVGQNKNEINRVTDFSAFKRGIKNEK